MATATQNGLMSSDVFKRSDQFLTFNKGIIYKVAKLNRYSGFIVDGISCGVTIAFKQFGVASSTEINTSTIIGDKPSFVTIKRDTNGYIYMRVSSGQSLDCFLYGNILIKVETVDDFPSDAVEL